jgi:hypothetical protein
MTLYTLCGMSSDFRVLNIRHTNELLGRESALYFRAYSNALSLQGKEQLLHICLSLHFVADINKHQRTLRVAA